MNMQPIVLPAIPELKEFFFEAALATYAGGTLKTTIPGLPHSKSYRYERGEFLYVDTFFTNGEYSGGQTVIYYQSKPVWLMHYHGWCKSDDPEVLAFLKQVLRYAYEKRIFHGGRGSYQYPLLDDDAPIAKKMLAYVNHGDASKHTGVSQREAFHKFSGIEFINVIEPDKPQREQLFWHRYQGMLLIPFEPGSVL